jgi:hypothetical protein
VSRTSGAFLPALRGFPWPAIDGRLYHRRHTHRVCATEGHLLSSPGYCQQMGSQRRGTISPGWPESRPLRILYVTARFLPERGGTEIHTYEVARRMSQRGAQVTVLATRRDQAQSREECAAGLRIVRVRAWPKRRDYFFAPELSAAIRAVGPDLLHCQGYHTFVAPVAMMAALRASIPYLVTFHSGGHSSRLRVQLRPLQARLLRPLLVRAGALVAVSDFEADLFSGRLRISRDRFAVIPSGIDLPLASEAVGGHREWACALHRTAGEL